MKTTIIAPRFSHLLEKYKGDLDGLLGEIKLNFEVLESLFSSNGDYVYKELVTDYLKHITDDLDFYDMQSEYEKIEKWEFQIQQTSQPFTTLFIKTIFEDIVRLKMKELAKKHLFLKPKIQLVDLVEKKKCPDNPEIMYAMKKGYNFALAELEQSKNKQTIELKKEDEEKVLENFHVWNSQNDKIQGKTNIFKNITQHKFLAMVNDADFSEIHKSGRLQNVRYNVYVLSRLLGKNWGERAAKNIGTTLTECQKRSNVPQNIKKMYSE